MMDNLVADILKRHMRNLTDRAALDQQLEEIRKYIDPFLPHYAHLPQAGESLPPQFDDTAIEASDNYIRGIHRAMTPADLAWVQLEHLDPDWDSDWEMRARQNRAERVIQNGLDASNFQAAMQGFWRLFGNAGTAFLHVEDKSNKGRFWFESFSSVGTSFWDDEEGRVDEIGRQREMTAAQIKKHGWNIAGTKVEECIDDNKPDEKFNVLHWIAPNNDIQPMRHGGLKYVSMQILMNGESGGAILNQEGTRFEGYEEFPVMCGRAIRVDGDNVGRSRAFSIVKRVKQLNRLCWIWDQGNEVSMLGFYKNKIDNHMEKTGDPNKINGGDTLYFDDPDKFQPAYAPTNFGMAWNEIKERQEQIRQHFFWHQLNMRMEKYNLTTMELMQAQAQAADLLAQQLSPAYNEVIVPFVERLLNIKMRSGEIEWPSKYVLAA